MLKLPKGLKKKKKGKKSKKDQELFTEEELEQYKREHSAQNQQPAEQHTDEQGTSDYQHYPDQPQAAAAAGADDEWSKFAALTTGVDSILKKTQGDLDRIKSTSFFQRVPPPSEVKKAEAEKKAAVAAAEEEKREEEAKDPVKALIDAVVELSESEAESEDEDDIFNTAYTEQELPLAYVPESPELEEFDGPDPFDTAYADKVIKGPEVSKRGRKIVNIGAAVEVLSGRVEKVTATAVRKRRGPINLLESFDHDHVEDGAKLDVTTTAASGPKSLLDDFADLPDDVPIDLSVSLHLVLQQQNKKAITDGDDDEQANKPNEDDAVDNILNEFDLLKKVKVEEVDEFAELAAESIAHHHPAVKAKPPPRPKLPTVAAELAAAFGEEEPEPDYDPFDTGFVEEVLPLTKLEDNEFDPRELDEDSDFDPRADEEEVAGPGPKEHLLEVQKPKDLLSGSSADLTAIGGETLAPCALEIDPFDTSNIDLIVQPGKTELKFLEKELLDDNNAISKLKQSLSDPDFDPRAEEEDKAAEAEFESLAKRKSSLSLHIHNNNLPSKLVSFSVATPDLLKADGNKVHQKPLTPYYNKGPSVDENEDPFDTSFVPVCQPTKVEINLLEKDFLNESHLQHSISDPDFDPRAITPITHPTNFEESKPKIISPTKADLLSVDEEYNIKVLTPATESAFDSYTDPFDTTIAANLAPGKAELKVLEDELCPAKPVGIKDIEQILAEPTDNSIYTKVLTPQPRQSFDFGGSLDDIDPFDTSIANNLAPGETEIKLLEKELIN